MKINRKNLYLFLTLVGLGIWAAHLWGENKSENAQNRHLLEMSESLRETTLLKNKLILEVVENMKEKSEIINSQDYKNNLKKASQIQFETAKLYEKISIIRKSVTSNAKNNLLEDLVFSIVRFENNLLTLDTSFVHYYKGKNIQSALAEKSISDKKIDTIEVKNLLKKTFFKYSTTETLFEIAKIEYKLAIMILEAIVMLYNSEPVFMCNLGYEPFKIFLPTSILILGSKEKIEIYQPNKQWTWKEPLLKFKNENVFRTNIDAYTTAIEFTAQSDTFNEFGYANKKLHFSYELSRIRTKKIIADEIDYIVTQPVINITSQQKAYFYEACANEFSMRVPSLGDEYLPEIKAENAKIVKIDDKGKVWVSPNGQTTKLKITNNGVELANLVYPVKKTPTPQIEILSNNRPLDWKNGGMIPQKISVKISPEANFQKEFPRDAQYFPSQIVVSLYRKGKNMYSSTFQAEKINLQTFEKKAKNGDYLIFEINSCLRKNFQNEMRLEKFETKTFVWAVL